MFQVLSWRPHLCLCLCLRLRICNCYCLCICVTVPFLNSSWHELSENVWVWGCGTVRSAEFDLWAKCRGWVVGGLDKRTSWSDLVGVRQKSCRKHHMSFVKRLHQDLVICRYWKRNYNLSSTIQMAQSQGEVEHLNKQVGTRKEYMWNSIRQTVKPKKG